MSGLKIGGPSGLFGNAALENAKEKRAAKAAGKEGATSPEQIDKVAGELESYFMRQILAEAHKSSDEKSSLDGGFAGGTFHDMLDGALADKMSVGQGLGLKKIIADSLQRTEASHELKAAQAAKIKGDVVVDAISRTRALKEIP
jgi:Rod binding domain-containing protein